MIGFRLRQEPKCKELYKATKKEINNFKSAKKVLECHWYYALIRGVLTA
jgi:hypothetical protein